MQYDATFPPEVTAAAAYVSISTMRDHRQAAALRITCMRGLAAANMSRRTIAAAIIPRSIFINSKKSALAVSALALSTIFERFV